MFSEFMYYIGYSIKKWHSLKNQKKLPFKVISIGNITVGGTGKTPAAIAVAEEAKKRGLNPVILTRGYRGKAKGPCFVISGQQKNSSLLYGDEPVLLAERLKDVPIVKCADRYEGGMFALQSLSSSNSPIHQFTNSPVVFILDDGFQHWKLHRDIDIVLVNGQNPYGNMKMLPLGPLREPLPELKRAGIFVITGKSSEARKPGSSEGEKNISSGLVAELNRYNPAAPVFFSKHRLTGIRDIKGNRPEMSLLKDKKVYAFCGLANPESFRQTVLSLGCDICGFKSYRDHYKYSNDDMSYLEAQARELTCDFLVTTEKDMVKLREMRLPENLLCAEISFYVDRAFFDQIFME